LPIMATSKGDLTALFQQVGMAAKAAGTALVIFIDELQYVQEPQMAALISALHRPKATSAGVERLGAIINEVLVQSLQPSQNRRRALDGF